MISFKDAVKVGALAKHYLIYFPKTEVIEIIEQEHWSCKMQMRFYYWHLQ